MADFKEYRSAFLDRQDDLRHYGVKGMKWGVVNERDEKTKHQRYTASERNKRDHAILWKKYPEYDSIGSDDITLFNELKNLTEKLMKQNLIPPKQLGPILKILGSYGPYTNRPGGFSINGYGGADRALFESYLKQLITIDKKHNYEKEAADRKAKAEAAKQHAQNHHRRR